MNEPAGSDRHASHVEARNPMRKPYKKPTVRFERVFETSALTCGKYTGGGGNCNIIHKTS